MLENYFNLGFLFVNKISITELKKHFINSNKEELLKEILGLFKNFSEVKEFYQSKLSNNGDSELSEKYKRIIKNEFFPMRGYGKARLSVARKAVMDFKKVSMGIHFVADVMIFYVEMAAKFVTENQIADSYNLRFKKMVEDTSGIGWGFLDELEEIYQQYFSREK